jgi:large conductance mechanosensitive channel
VGDLIMPVVGAVFGKLDFSSLFVVLGNVPPGTAMTLDALKKAGRSGFRLRQLHYGGRELHHSGVHHFPDGQADQPPQARSLHQRPAPALTPEDVLLLREIRDSLRK